MRFTSVLTAALFGAAAAAPTAAAPQAEMPRIREAVRITDFYARKAPLNGTLGGPVSSVSFKITPVRGNGTVPVSCSATAAEGEKSIRFKPTAYPCEDSSSHWDQYSFEVSRPKPQGIFDITVIHKAGPGFGVRGRASVPTYCHAGGADSLVCGQVANVTVGLHR
ncbi:uncharacterized protein P884DRAFT_283443 [Thermothelomyces heterothallicus CBS 202.75]|uniref:uncharacterized protein n=1 Tax=Thermothelomyces heterothallicus CBS 202.75 TaxID=1149848 RepID=UPI0037429317